MKKILSILLALIMCLGLFVSCGNDENSSSQSETKSESSSESGEESPSGNEEQSEIKEGTQGLKYLSLPDATLEVFVGTARYVENIVIPEEYNGAKVTKIAEDGFKNLGSLKSISIPDTVTSIGARAFENCTSLKSVAIPCDVSEIGNDAFKYCPLESAVVPVNAISSIPKDLLEKVTILGAKWDNCTIPTGTFADCDLLSIVILPNGAIIKEGAFNNCPLLASIVIPENVTEVEAGAFKNCHLTEVSAPHFALSGLPHDTVKKLTVTTFNEETNSTYDFILFTALEELTLPSGIKRIGYDFEIRNCHTIKRIKLPDTVTSIGSRAFENCTSLEIIEIPNSVTSIDSFAFNGCKSLKTITIPTTVTQMRSNTFAYCESLETINCEATKKPDGWDNDWLNRECTATVNWGYAGE